MEMKKPNRLQGLLLFFWVIYINKSSIKSQPTNQPKRKRFLAPKPKNSRQIFATVEFKPSVKKKIHEHFQPRLESRDRSTYRGETEQTNMPL